MVQDLSQPRPCLGSRGRGDPTPTALGPDHTRAAGWVFFAASALRRLDSLSPMKVYTRKGDDGTTGLLYGDRVRKDAPGPVAYGAVDEAQAAIGLARAEVAADPAASATDLGALLLAVEKDLWVLMAELATAPEKRERLEPGASLVTSQMVEQLERSIDDVSERFDPPTEFVAPGETRIAALLDVARTVTRRAERDSLAAAAEGSYAVPYLNRLSDLLWTLARWQEGQSRAMRAI